MGTGFNKSLITIINLKYAIKKKNNNDKNLFIVHTLSSLFNR